MKVPYSWLKDYADINVDAKELGDLLTLSGSALEGIIVQGDKINRVIVCQFKEIEKHPEAERLNVCQVDIGEDELLQIVTAATNMKVGDKVPVALHKSTLADGTEIKKGKLRGIVSNGMFCSEAELGLKGEDEVDGLMILDTDAPIGKEIKEYLGLKKETLDFDITSNRPDCLSMIGMARETAATLRTSYKMPSLEFEIKNTDNINDILKVNVNDKLCRRYMARMIKNVKIGPSPKWIQDRLLEAGVRPINNIVDITNFVMLETGEPMHAFDRRFIKSGEIVIEKANDGVKFTTLDEVERTLTNDTLCIKDGDEIIALAGIMGGLNSEVKEDTTEIILECANFEGTNIRVNSKKLGVRTESSSRFEKDIDPNLAEIAIDRACALICELGAGEVCTGTIDVYNEVKEEKTITVDYKWINKFLGTDISKEEMKRCLDSLDQNTVIDGDNLVVTIPTFRVDLNIKEDIAEEVVRIFGYNKVEGTIFKVQTEREPKYRNEILNEQTIEIMTASGLNQSISYSFISPKAFDKICLSEDDTKREAVKIKNPLGEDYSIMRTTTIASMMESLARNYTRNNSEALLFEIGKVYIKAENEEDIPTERNILTIGMYGDVDYLNLKGVVENLIDGLGVKGVKVLRESENNSFHPGKTAKLIVGRKIEAGVFGEVHPDVSENFGIDKPCYIAELDLDAIYDNSVTDKKYTPLPKFPAVTRDIALLVDDEVLVQDIEDAIVKAGGNLVEKVQLFDIYKGEQIPEGKKSIAYAIWYRDAKKTLNDKEVNKVHDKILKALEYKLGAILR
ncbi:MAG: phenylalanine--tRNA ligase subunit beta [Clostridium sp.]|uniref:phenylalanine--tRNA ligase subunit beta n=1 Tax=Clostridium sp. TaxID=1506 RepID=UPI003EE5E8DC